MFGVCVFIFYLIRVEITFLIRDFGFRVFLFDFYFLSLGNYRFFWFWVVIKIWVLRSFGIVCRLVVRVVKIFVLYGMGERRDGRAVKRLGFRIRFSVFKVKLFRVS